MDRFAEVTNKTREVLALAERLYGVKLSPTISYNLRGRVAGWAGCRRCRITGTAGQFTLRFNREMIAGKHFEDIRDETVPHEVAHLVCYARPELGRNHDGGWRRVCLALGGNGKTRHSYDVNYAGGNFVYLSERGTPVTVSRHRHTKIQNGTVYMCRRSGRVDRYCAWAPEGETPRVRLQRPAAPPRPSWAQPWQNRPAAPAAQPAATMSPAQLLAALQQAVTVPMPAAKPTAAAAQPAAGASWADRVRAVIREARAAGRDQSWVINHAVNVMGMKATSARNCVKANWERA